MARDQSNDIAIIGFSSKFPGPDDFDEWWESIIKGEVLTRRLDQSQLNELGVPKFLSSDPEYVPVRGFLENADRFDNKVFNVSPRDAEMMDPQHRLMLEASWSALEDAGYAKSEDMPITGVYASSSGSGYARTILSNGPLEPDLLEQVIHGTDPDFISSLISYKLNLTGPAISVQTACSSSLVGVHLACQAIRNGDCEQALVVAAGIAFPQGGYLHIPGGINSASGICRPFDAAADGVVEGSGVACVVLRKFSNLPKDSVDPHGVILGTAVNNDGAAKAGYFAPSISGQISVIQDAIKNANADPKSIGYLETHGTGTNIGDPIEWTATSEAYKKLGALEGQIAIGTLKGNVGHLDATSGLASLIKTIKVLKEGVVPKVVNFKTLNPFMESNGSPLRIQYDALHQWPKQSLRRAAISAFGIGGTNAHIIIEQPDITPDQSRLISERPCIIPLSACDKGSLNQLRKKIAGHIVNKPDSIVNVAYTLTKGRAHLSERLVVAGRSNKEIVEKLGNQNHLLYGQKSENEKKNAVFLFTGQGSQHPGMAKPFSNILPNFNDHLDECFNYIDGNLKNKLCRALLDFSFPEEELNQTELAQPALFAMEYAIAKSLIDLGIKPEAVCGHSLGEIVAGHFSGLYCLQDAMKLVIERGKSMQDCPEGSMLAVNMPENKLANLIDESALPLSISAVNSDESCVVAASLDTINNFKQFLGERVRSITLKTNRAFHSPLIENSIEKLKICLSSIELLPNRLPISLNVSGRILEKGARLPPNYFIDQARQPVLFAQSLRAIQKSISNPLFIEIGSGQILTSMALAIDADALPLCSNKTDDSEIELLTSLGGIWTHGLSVNLSSLNPPGRRLHLPTYPFFGPKWLAPEALKGLNKDLDNSESHSNDVNKFTVETLSTNNHEIGDILTALWQETLGQENIDEESNFFSLGGDSLLITTLIRKVNQAFNIKVPPRKMLAMQTFQRQRELIKEIMAP